MELKKVKGQYSIKLYPVVNGWEYRVLMFKIPADVTGVSGIFTALLFLLKRRK
ncbi:hypothetical protein [Sellimonas intestinalis]|uniref:hypothetical protein n=1 Tax=Sellimonas intestinalis TaxID=1653434 RepID=UPI0036F295D4